MGEEEGESCSFGHRQFLRSSPSLCAADWREGDSGALRGSRFDEGLKMRLMFDEAAIEKCSEIGTELRQKEVKIYRPVCWYVCLPWAEISAPSPPPPLFPLSIKPRVRFFGLRFPLLLLHRSPLSFGVSYFQVRFPRPDSGGGGGGGGAGDRGGKEERSGKGSVGCQLVPSSLPPFSRTSTHEAMALGWVRREEEGTCRIIIIMG